MMFILRPNGLETEMQREKRERERQRDRERERERERESSIGCGKHCCKRSSCLLQLIASFTTKFSKHNLCWIWEMFHFVQCWGKMVLTKF